MAEHVLLQTCKGSSRHVIAGIYVGFLCVDHDVGVYNFLAVHMCLNASIKKELAISQ